MCNHYKWFLNILLVQKETSYMLAATPYSPLTSVPNKH